MKQILFSESGKTCGDKAGLIPPPWVMHVVVALTERGFPSFVVGGAVRDKLLGLETSDWDVATAASSQEVMSVFPKVVPTGVRYGTVTVILGHEKVEVSSFKGANIFQDLGHRDFTIDAMAWDPLTDSIVDPYDGARDLKAGIVRGVGDPVARLKEDPLRAMRAFRIGAELGFRIHRKTLVAIAYASSGMEGISPERIRQELTRTLVTSRAAFALRGMAKTGILQRVLPELTGGQEAIWPDIRGRLGRVFRSLVLLPPRPDLRWAALLRGAPGDGGGSIGAWMKGTHLPLTRRARLAVEVLRRLRFSRNEGRSIANLIASADLLVRVKPSDPFVRHLVRIIGPERMGDAFLLRKAQIVARGRAEASLARLSELEERVAAWLGTSRPEALHPVITGAEVMEILGIPPGPKVGEVLRDLQELVVKDPLTNTREFLSNWIRGKVLR